MVLQSKLVMMVLEHIFAKAYSLVKVVYLYCFFISLRTSYFSSSGDVDYRENIWYLVCLLFT